MSITVDMLMFVHYIVDKFFRGEKMGPNIVINGKEVTNPVTKVLISLSAFLSSILIAVLLVFFILPFVGIAFAGTVGIMVTVLVSMLIGLPLLLITGGIITLLSAPFRKRRD